jgi:hypothetical protein
MTTRHVVITYLAIARTALAHPEPVSVTRQAACPAKGAKTFANAAGTAIAPLRDHTRRVSLDCKI